VSTTSASISGASRSGVRIATPGGLRQSPKHGSRGVPCHALRLPEQMAEAIAFQRVRHCADRRVFAALTPVFGARDSGMWIKVLHLTWMHVTLLSMSGLQELPDTFTTATALARGVHPRVLY
jgi:hypothetical protein